MTKTGLTICTVSVLFFFSAASSLQGPDYSPVDVTITSRDGYEVVEIPECHYTSELGEPMMPYSLIHVAIPRGMEVSGVTGITSTSEEIPGSHLLFPSQKSRPISQPGSDEFIEPKRSVYSSSSPYPGELIEVGTSNYMAGHHIVSFVVYPVQYIPREGRLTLHRDIRFELELTPSSPARRIQKRSRRAAEMIRESVKGMVINPEDVTFVAEEIIEPSMLQQSGILEYVVITKATYFDEFRPLVEWKTRKGIPAVLRDVDWITSAYTGRDTQERIRNYLKDLEADSGTVWVLLGADDLWVPHRGVYCETSSETDYDIPCDSYYGNLDGSWDNNDNDIFGEHPGDVVDFYPDLYIGRATIDTHDEVTRFVNKVFTYERDPTLDYLTKALFFTAHVDPQTDPRILKEYIRDNYVAAWFDVDILSDVAPSVVRDSLSKGYNIVNHDGHGNEYAMYTYWDSQYLTNASMNGLLNAPRYSAFLFTCGCYCGAFDMGDCIGEYFFKAASGGGFFVGQSRYGWYTPGSPISGSTAAFDRGFFSQIFNYNRYHLGHTLAQTKNSLAGSTSDDYYRWVYYCYNLFGDPELPIWTETPEILTATHPDSVLSGSADPFTVNVSAGGSPVSGALVCLWKEDQVYLQETTNGSGVANFTPDPYSPGTLWVTVTKQHYVPYDSLAMVYGYIPPQAAFSQDVTEGMVPLSIQFTDESTGSVDSWHWIFGDGEESYEENPLHLYQECGRFDVTLMVSGPAGGDTIVEEFATWALADTITVPNGFATPGQTKRVRVQGARCDSLAGYAFAMYFDTTYLWVDSVTLSGTCGEGALISIGGVDSTEGYVSWGVVYGFTPPWIPQGDDHLFNVHLTIKPWVAIPSTTWFDLENDIGGLADNTFTTWDGIDIYPVLQDGRLLIVDEVGFIRGDANSSTDVSMADAIYTLKYLYVPGSPSPQCMDGADATDDEAIEMSDAIYTLKYLYVPGSPPPPSPCCDYPDDCGPDPDGDILDCGGHPCTGGKGNVSEMKKPVAH